MPELDETSHAGGSARGSADDVARELRMLAAQIGSLQADVRRLESPPLPRDSAGGWDEPAQPPASFGWISSLETPRRARVRIPRLPLELAFLAGAAALAGLAHLRPLVIAGVMGGGWLIVVLAEWAGARGDRLRHRLFLETPVVPPQPGPEAVRADPTWFTPPVEHTLIARPAESAGQESAGQEGDAEQRTTITKLGAPDAETTAERRPGG